MYWTIAQAVVLLQDLESHELRAGYNVFIGGSVAHKGLSDDDLDLVAVPRVIDSAPNVPALFAAFRRMGYNWVGSYTLDRLRKGYCLVNDDGLTVDLVIIHFEQEEGG